MNAISAKNIFSGRAMPVANQIIKDMADSPINRAETRYKQFEQAAAEQEKKQEQKGSRAFAPEIIKIMDETWDVPAFIRRKK